MKKPELFGTPPPIFLAPMAGFTDLTFRTLCYEFACDLAYTEMISAKGLHYNNDKTAALLATSESEVRLAVQLFGSDPAIMADIALRLCDFLGEKLVLIDLNMGCPAPKITGNGDGSALMRDLPLAARVLSAVCSACPAPVTVKFRKGWDDASVNALEFARMAEDSGVSAMTIHGRTRAQQYGGRADWDCIAAVKQAVRVPVVGNGDVRDVKSAKALLAHTGCDGIMIGRGALGNPFLFAQIRAALRGEEALLPTEEERIALALRHARMLTAAKGAHGIVELRKHIPFYLHGMTDAARLRAKSNAVKSVEELEEVLTAGCGVHIM